MYDNCREGMFYMITAKEVTKQLGIDRERIKYYKKMGVFQAESTRAGYYTENDVRNLRKLVMLGKAGLTCDDIKRVQNGEQSLIDVTEERRTKIKEKMDRMLSSLILSMDLIGTEAQYNTLEIDRCWNFINQREGEGKEFMEFEESDMPLSLIRTVQCPYCDAEQDVDLEEYVYSEYRKDENDEDSEIIYLIDSTEEYDCEHCGETFRIMGETSEFPLERFLERIVEIRLEDMEYDADEEQD